jgi:hypothetical protein
MLKEAILLFIKMGGMVFFESEREFGIRFRSY